MLRRLPQTPRVRCGLYVTPTNRTVRIAGWTLPPPSVHPVAIVVAVSDGARYTIDAATLVSLEAAHGITIR